MFAHAHSGLKLEEKKYSMTKLRKLLKIKFSHHELKEKRSGNNCKP